MEILLFFEKIWQQSHSCNSWLYRTWSCREPSWAWLVLPFCIKSQDRNIWWNLNDSGSIEWWNCWNTETKESDSHAGMDIALCCIDLVTKELKYAGANRPLYFIRDHQGWFSENPINSRSEDFDWMKTVCSRNKLYSFGKMIHFTFIPMDILDQFGGVQGKKIMTKKIQRTSAEHSR